MTAAAASGWQRTRLRRAVCTGPGIHRIRRGRGFAFVGDEGERVTEEEVLARIHELVIPPAWEEVWICPYPGGHIQATGVDERGRKQYVYHPKWRESRDREKFEDMAEFARALPDLREHVDQDLARRVQSVVDPEVAEVIAALKRQRGGGQELLAWRRGRRWVDLRSPDINEYLKRVTALDVSAKDFRTWGATVLAAIGLAVAAPNVRSATASKRAISRAVKEVARYLGNTPAVAHSSYIDPRVFDRFAEGYTIGPVLTEIADDLDATAIQGPVEDAVLDLLEGPRSSENVERVI